MKIVCGVQPLLCINLSSMFMVVFHLLQFEIEYASTRLDIDANSNRNLCASFRYKKQCSDATKQKKNIKKIFFRVCNYFDCIRIGQYLVRFQSQSLVQFIFQPIFCQIKLTQRIQSYAEITAPMCYVCVLFA